MTQDATQDATQQLRDLCAQAAVYTTVSGERVEVVPLKVRQLAAFARAIEPLMDSLAAIRGLPQAEQMAAVGAVVVRRCDDVAQAVAVATGRGVDWVSELDLDDLVGLALMVLEVNADFFVRRLLPMLERAMPAAALRIEALTGAPSAAPTPPPAGSA